MKYALAIFVAATLLLSSIGLAQEQTETPILSPSQPIAITDLIVAESTKMATIEASSQAPLLSSEAPTLATVQLSPGGVMIGNTLKPAEPGSQIQLDIVEPVTDSGAEPILGTPTTPVSMIVEYVSDTELTMAIGNSVVSTSETLVYSGQSLEVAVGDGTEPIAVFPNELPQIASGAGLQTIVDAELTVTEASPVYELSGTTPVRILWVIPATMPVETTIDAQTGAVLETNKPWWSVVAVAA